MAVNTNVVSMDTREDSYGDNAFVSDTNHFGGSDSCTEAFHCPITKDIMIKPVVLVADGTTYEESALKDWLSENNMSPLTGMELKTKEYHPNYALQHAITDYLTTQQKRKQNRKNKKNTNKKNMSNNSNNNNNNEIRTPRSPKSAVSSDMDIEDELISYHSDDEKKDQLLTLSNKQTNGDIITMNGELDTRAAIKDAKFDKLQIFLVNNECGDYINIFIKEGFQSINDLYNITFPDMLAMNIPRGHGRRLLNAIMQYKIDLNNSKYSDTSNDLDSNSNSVAKAGGLKLGDPTMSIIDDGSFVDVSFNAQNRKLNNDKNENNDNNSKNDSKVEAGIEMKQSTIAPHNSSLIIYPGKKLPKSRSAAPLNVNVLLLGDAYVGKTSLRKRLELNDFVPTHATQGVELTCLSGTYQSDDLQITVWDPAGQERYAPITKTFFRRAHGAAIVFSADDENTWKHVTYWLNELETNAPDDIEVMLVCNKVDLLFKDNNNNNNENETKQNELEDALIKNAIEVAAQKRIPFYMTSAKSGECVVQAFQELVTQIMANEGIVNKIYETRDGIAMKLAGTKESRQESINNNNKNKGITPNGNKKNFTLLTRFREQRRRYQASQQNSNNINKRGIVDLSKNNDVIDRPAGCCGRY